MKIIKPKKLEKGDTIGILAVSGRIKEYERIEHAALYFENCGYKVVISSTCKTSHRYIAGNSDEDCINALHNFFEDEKINAILCARGGFGTLRLLDKINWNVIEKNPKIFAGYSDITTLLTMIYKKTGLITFHSAMANGDFGETIEEYTKQSFFNTLTGNTTEFSAENAVLYNTGSANGILWGGNFSTLAALCGTDFVPNTDLILFIEDLNEPAYKIDKMLTQLFNLKEIRQNVKAIAIGEFKDIDNIDFVDEIITEISLKYNIPAVRGFKITHNKIKDTMPVGVKAAFEAQAGKITINENYVL